MFAGSLKVSHKVFLPGPIFVGNYEAGVVNSARYAIINIIIAPGSKMVNVKWDIKLCDSSEQILLILNYSESGVFFLT